MLDGLKRYIGNKVAQTSMGKEAIKKELDKMPLPPHAKAMFMKIIENRPELLAKIAEETDTLIKQGKSQMQASQSVMMKYKKELQDAMR